MRETLEVQNYLEDMISFTIITPNNEDYTVT